MKIALINGPNLNLTGIREPQWYGETGIEEILVHLRRVFNGVEIAYYQSNVEGELINAIQQYGADPNYSGIVINAGAYSHTSIALADAIKAINTPVVGVHISNVYQREKERHTDLLAAACVGNIIGFGLKGYEMALWYFVHNH